VGGLFTSFLMELVVYPVVYRAWRWHRELKWQVGTVSVPAEEVVRVAGFDPANPHVSSTA
jgi:hypothetical protein